MPPAGKSNTRRHQRFEMALEDYLDTAKGTAKRPFRTRSLGSWPRGASPSGLKSGPPLQQRGVYRRRGRPRNLI